MLHDANRYLEELEVIHTVTIHDGVFSTTDLSTGQRKRLALIQVFLENRRVGRVGSRSGSSLPASLLRKTAAKP